MKSPKLIVRLTRKTKLFSLGRSNAFPDVIDFAGVRYLAFRTALLHFPILGSRIVVYKQCSGKSWIKETEFTLPHHDVRNPKFFIYQGHLCLLFAATPAFSLLLEKSSTYVTQQEHPKVWTYPALINNGVNLNPFRFHYHQHLPVLSAFHGNYSPHVCFLSPQTLTHWLPFSPFSSLQLSGTETDFIETPTNYYFVSRLDYSSKRHSGSRFVNFDKHSGQLTSRNTRIKLDAPFLFSHQQNYYLLARRNMLFWGRYNLFPKYFPTALKNFLNHLIYWLTPKSLSLWQFDPVRQTVKHLLKFPVHGDTGYAVAVPKGVNSFEVFTYSNVHWRHTPWLLGQLTRTHIFSFVLKFTR